MSICTRDIFVTVHLSNRFKRTIRKRFHIGLIKINEEIEIDDAAAVGVFEATEFTK
jgi:hypothetical protein